MTQVLKKFQPGERIDAWPGGTWGVLVDVAEEFKKTRRRILPESPGGGTMSPVRCILMSDEEEAPIPEGATVVLGDPLTVPDDRESTPFENLGFKCTLPDGDTPEDAHVAVVLGPMLPGGTTWGVIPSAAWAKVEVEDDDHEFAVLQAGAALKSAASGRFPIVWKPDGAAAEEDPVWCVVLLTASGGGAPTVVAGWLEATIPKLTGVGEGVETACIVLDDRDAAAVGIELGEAINGINYRPYEIEASETDKVRVYGILRDTPGLFLDEEHEEPAPTKGLEVFFHDQRSTPGFVLGEPQVESHYSGTREAHLGSGPCTTDP